MRNDDEALERLRAAIEQVAESEAGAIVAEARAQARAKVRAILAEAMRQSVEDLQWLENNARTHEYVLDSIRERATVVPMRLCTIYRTEDSVREMLAREGDFLADALTRLAGRTEWGVKIFLNAADARPARDSSGARELADQLTEAGPGESYMLSKRLEALRAVET